MKKFVIGLLIGMLLGMVAIVWIADSIATAFSERATLVKHAPAVR